MEISHGSQIPYDPGPYFSFLAANRAAGNFASQVSVILAGGEGRRYAQVGKTVAGEHGLNQFLGHSLVLDSLPEVQVQHSAAGIQALQFVLQVEGLKYIIAKVDRKLGS